LALFIFFGAAVLFSSYEMVELVESEVISSSIDQSDHYDLNDFPLDLAFVSNNVINIKIFSKLVNKQSKVSNYISPNWFQRFQRGPPVLS